MLIVARWPKSEGTVLQVVFPPGLIGAARNPLFCNFIILLVTGAPQRGQNHNPHLASELGHLAPLWSGAVQSGLQVLCR